jgi:hypothetical protein
MDMGRAVGAVVVGAAAWAALWNLGSLVARTVFPGIIAPELPVTHRGALLGFVLYGVLLSVLTGYLTAAVRGPRPMRSVWALACLLFALGVGFEAAFWRMTPPWYHWVFLALIVPATVWGGRIRAGRSADPEAA